MIQYFRHVVHVRCERAVARSVDGNRKLFSARISCIVRESIIQGVHLVQVRVAEDKPAAYRPVRTAAAAQPPVAAAADAEVDDEEL